LELFYSKDNLDLLNFFLLFFNRFDNNITKYHTHAAVLGTLAGFTIGAGVILTGGYLYTLHLSNEEIGLLSENSNNEGFFWMRTRGLGHAVRRVWLGINNCF
jgi:hypothetical protein